MGEIQVDIDRCWIILMALERLGKIVTKTKLQKLIFLVQEEAQIIGGYNFRKHYYGPHSHHLTLDVELLAQNDYINKDYAVGINRNYNIYRATKKGNSLFKENFCPKSDPDLMEKAQNIVDKYGNCSYKELTEYVYKKYLPEPGEYKGRLKTLLDNVSKIEEIWKGEYSPESELFVDLMATIEYINLLFKKIDTLSFLDPVVKGVLLVTSEDLVEILFKITEQYFGTESPEETIKELNQLVSFLGYYSQKNNVLANIDELDYSDILSEEEIENLKAIPEEDEH